MGPTIKRINIILFLSFTCFSLYYTSEDVSEKANLHEDPIVSVTEGQLRGLLLTSRKGRNYFGFLGVDYAANPERFEIAQPTSAWKGIKNATSFGHVCAHQDIITSGLLGGENCLSLNIYTPKTRGRMPVLVFFHGGGFTWGDSNGYGAKYFMDEHVILVTVNYRLGILGFLSTEDDIIQGNFGLKDQTASLKWIKRNIENFGGDPDKVTIFGNSAGAASVNYHLLSPMSKGLFMRAISQSGSVLQPLAFQRYPLENAKKLSIILDCPLKQGTRGSENFKTCLKTKPVRQIVDAQKFFRNDAGELPSPFSPSVEKVSIKEGKLRPVFLSDLPYNLLKDIKLKSKLNLDVPWMIGLCKDEAVALMGAALNEETESGLKMVKAFAEDTSTILSMALLYENTVEKDNLPLISDEILKFYFAGRKIGKETANELSNLYADRWNNHGIRTAAKLAARQGLTVYPYIFSFEGAFSFSGFFGAPPKYKGVNHMDELQYLFNITLFSVDVPEIIKGKQLQLSQNLIKTWISFANTGVPVDMSSAANKWDTISKDIGDTEPLWYTIDGNNNAMGDAPFSTRMKFWDELPMLLEFDRDVSRVDKKDEL